MNGHSLHFGTRYPTQSTARGSRSSPARPSPGPGRSRPRRTNSARTTSRPVTRTSRRTGEPPPTPHRCLGESHAAVHSNPTLPDAAGPTGDSGDSDTFTKARRYKDVRARKARNDYPSIRRGAPPGRFRHHRSITAPRGPASGNREVSHPMSTGTEPDLGQARGARNLSQPPK